MNFYKRHIGDYLKATSHLSLLEHGIYTRLLDVYYTREGAIPADQAARLVGARSKDEREALDAVLTEFFVQVGGAWTQKRCDEEIAHYQEKAERNREVGKKGGRPVTQKEPTNNPDGFQNVTQTEPTNNPSHKPLAISHKPEEKSNPPPAARSPSRKKPMPNNFAISDRVRAWAKEKGYSQLEAHFESFVSKVRAKGYAYIDWDEAFMGAIRENWAKLTPIAAPGPKKLTVHDRADLEFEKKYGTAESLGHLMQKLGVSHA